MKKESKKDLLTVIIPCYNEEEGIAYSIDHIMDILIQSKIPFEMLLVDDGSIDSTFSIIEEKSLEFPHIIRGIRFSRNFGKEAAILAGMEYAQGECAVIIDSDLQHPPYKIIEMYQLWEEGYDIVEGIKENRPKESVIRKLFVKVFYYFFSKAIGIDMMNASDFKLIDRKIINILLQMPEKSTFFRGLTYWTGYKMITVKYQVEDRERGKSKWSFRKLVSYAISNIVSFSSYPLHIITWLSQLMLIMATIFGIRALRLYFTNQAAGGVTTVVILLLFIGGLILMALSIMGKYISSIYDELKGRPRYLVNKSIGIYAPNDRTINNRKKSKDY